MKLQVNMVATISLLLLFGSSAFATEDSTTTEITNVAAATPTTEAPELLPVPLLEPIGPSNENMGFRPSIWSRTVHSLREGGRKPHHRMRYFHKSTEMRPIAPPATNAVADEEKEILQSDELTTLKNFANLVVNETAALIKASPEPRGLFRSYPGTAVGAEDSSQTTQQQQFWDDKDQAYHASSYSGIDYEPPTAYHHSFHHSPPLHYYPPPHKKDDALFTKFALIALLKLIFAKLKAIGFLKILLLFTLKVPLLFFKLLIALKGLKFLKLLSIPFLLLVFALPLLPLIPLLLFAFLPLLLLIPLALPLLLPLLMFLPIIPVTAPATGAAANVAVGRKKRNIPVPESVTANSTWTFLDEQWKLQSQTPRKRRNFHTRSRPASSPRRSGISRLSEPLLNEEHSDSLLDLTQRVVQSQHCMERAACEFASYNDSQLYQSAVIWALGKLHTYAPHNVQRKLVEYSQAYEKGLQKRSSDYCAERFKCNRPKLYLVQGHHTYNVI